jgi:hypothetical protein
MRIDELSQIRLSEDNETTGQYDGEIGADHPGEESNPPRCAECRPSLAAANSVGGVASRRYPERQEKPEMAILSSYPLGLGVGDYTLGGAPLWEIVRVRDLVMPLYIEIDRAVKALVDTTRRMAPSGC